MTKGPSEPHVEETVHFLNVDVELSGAFDREALLGGFGDAIFVLRDDEDDSGRAMRLERARVLLTETASSITEIAFEVGFSAPRTLARLLREVGDPDGLPTTAFSVSTMATFRCR